ncbi:SET domain-containing protein [Zopfia rhizophila CBS 207.26]|uniref:SET domain-containing protein n=1 Tax=Zopfia rhizophila CBS 207.26 TaxID=1314779 RepID=A0A6A6EAV7_9PEZI|nr:SET domain-containing protein [Zopfia rhizophila CBS 207.26]
MLPFLGPYLWAWPVLERQNPAVKSAASLSLWDKHFREGRRSLKTLAQNIEFQCESIQVSPLIRHTEDDLLSFLEPVQYLEKNSYEPVDGWLKPRNWQWDWPMDPTWAPPDTKCDMCKATPCDCISTLPKNRYRILYYGAKGRGIQARASSPGGLAFEKDQYIGELTGKLVPPDTYDNSMTINLNRSDIDEEPVVCQVYCQDQGNWVRLVNHSCKPCARLVAKIVSGKAGVMLQATQDIYDGAEVTVNYGRGHFGNNDCLCEVCKG